jgi:hypothetical protein
MSPRDPQDAAAMLSHPQYLIEMMEVPGAVCCGHLLPLETTWSTESRNDPD